MMLDWDSITPETRGAPGQDANTEPEQSVPACPGENGTCPGKPGQPRANNGAASGGFVPVVPVFPAKKQRDGTKQDENGAGGGVAANDFASGMKDDGAPRHPFNAVAVVLLVAYCEKVGATADEMGAALSALRALPPSEQVRQWWQACMSENMKPWRLIHLPTPGEGMECTGCRNINLINGRVPGSRGQFHWSCKLGYLIHETGRYTERILVAPPECQDFERWRPSE